MKHVRTHLLLAMLILVAAACGGGDTEEIRTIEITGVDTMAFVVAGEEEGLTVGDQRGDEFILQEIQVSPGEEITIQLTTRSELPETVMSHNLIILEPGTDTDNFSQQSASAVDNDYIAPALEGSVVVSTSMLSGGESETITFTAPDEPGEYEFICSFPGHYLAGMRGVIVVQ